MIEGGIPYLIKTKQKLLVSAYVTNTRLMGVLALYAHWRISGTDEMLDFHQFFYIDCEESGLETYTGILGSDHSEIDATEQALVGGLGAEKIEISYPQLSGILTFYRMFNEAHGLPLPRDTGSTASCWSRALFSVRMNILMSCGSSAAKSHPIIRQSITF